MGEHWPQRDDLGCHLVPVAAGCEADALTWLSAYEILQVIKVEDELEGVTTVIIWNMVDTVVGRSASLKESRATGAGQVSRLDVGLLRKLRSYQVICEAQTGIAWDTGPFKVGRPGVAFVAFVKQTVSGSDVARRPWVRAFVVT
jgi:hypothetical protein